MAELPILRNLPPGVRERHVEGYRVAYEVAADTGSNTTAGDVTVLRVFGPGQQRTDPRGP